MRSIIRKTALIAGTLTLFGIAVAGGAEARPFHWGGWRNHHFGRWFGPRAYYGGPFYAYGGPCFVERRVRFTPWGRVVRRVRVCRY